MSEKVILVDENDAEIGWIDKLQAHELGLLHRAISVFIFNFNGELLLQKRALNKYHSANLWTNTACSHPFPDEPVENAATRRLMQEMGLRAELKYCFKFTYKAELSNNLVEHEIDHVFIGHTNEAPTCNPQEVAGWRWVNESDLANEIQTSPHHFTEWFKLCYRDVFSYLKTEKNMDT